MSIRTRSVACHGVCGSIAIRMILMRSSGGKTAPRGKGGSGGGGGRERVTVCETGIWQVLVLESERWISKISVQEQARGVNLERRFGRRARTQTHCAPFEKARSYIHTSRQSNSLYSKLK